MFGKFSKIFFSPDPPAGGAPADPPADPPPPIEVGDMLLAALKENAAPADPPADPPPPEGGEGGNPPSTGETMAIPKKDYEDLQAAMAEQNAFIEGTATQALEYGNWINDSWEKKPLGLSQMILNGVPGKQYGIYELRDVEVEKDGKKVLEKKAFPVALKDDDFPEPLPEPTKTKKGENPDDPPDVKKLREENQQLKSQQTAREFNEELQAEVADLEAELGTTGLMKKLVWLNAKGELDGPLTKYYKEKYSQTKNWKGTTRGAITAVARDLKLFDKKTKLPERMAPGITGTGTPAEVPSVGELFVKELSKQGLR